MLEVKISKSFGKKNYNLYDCMFREGWFKLIHQKCSKISFKMFAEISKNAFPLFLWNLLTKNLCMF